MGDSGVGELGSVGVECRGGWPQRAQRTPRGGEWKVESRERKAETDDFVT